MDRFRPRPPRRVRPTSPRRPARRGSLGPRRGGNRRTGHSPLLLAAAGVALYLAVLWLGIAVIGDNPIRSAFMAGLIVAIAGFGYLASRRPAPRDE